MVVAWFRRPYRVCAFSANSFIPNFSQMNFPCETTNRLIGLLWMTLLVTNKVIIFGCTFLVKFFTMADDIDDLLSEVESKFCSKNSTSHTSKNSRIRTPSDNTNKRYSLLSTVYFPVNITVL